MKCESCRFCCRVLNEENRRKYGRFFCKFWHEYIEIQKIPNRESCRDYEPKESEDGE